MNRFNRLSILKVTFVMLFFKKSREINPVSSVTTTTVRTSNITKPCCHQLDTKELELTWERTVKKRQYGMVMLWDFFPPSYNCPLPIERIGRIGDGGKWICGFTNIINKPSPCVVYSFGIGDEVSFEQEVLERTKCIVRMFDHTININNCPAANLISKYPTRAILYKLGLGNPQESKLPASFTTTLKTEMLKHNEEFIDILKIDIEGQEYFLIDQLVTEFKNYTTFPFGQLQIEIHAEGKSNDFKILKKLFDELETAGLIPFHSEPNFYQLQYLNTTVVSHEYSFINTKFIHNLLN